MTVMNSLITPTNVATVRKVVIDQSHHEFVVRRKARNIDVPGSPITLSRASMWRVHVGCLLTTQQQSGQGSYISALLDQKPFVLSYNRCCETTDVFRFVRDTLRRYPGIRFRENKIPDFMERNLRDLNAGGWEQVEIHGRILCETRSRPADWSGFESSFEREMSAAKYMKRYQGLGLKQSRNFWQWLGLTRFVCVLDSRVKKWCCSNLEGRWSIFNLNRNGDYLNMADSIRALCRETGVLPCLFDAAVFSTFEALYSRASHCR